ncbi:threonine-phosphate decarboxylase CobD [Psychromonas sp. psych-6C06]|uniref:threonine-phosphate decarboxylase CobD n=1 Tax=Psychromonas sp. psych-6C06 TaxID=2058089 RepID=UPI00187C3F16|nr:threonine-phosphate decarboxylase CobD [Psychromonas sp. psych-6C06]
MAILHGGQLERVATQFNIPRAQWLDLSTGIAPYSYPIPDIPAQAWQQLPHISSRLIAVAKVYYQAQHCWPVAGSQQLIEKLPQLWEKRLSASSKEMPCKHVYLPKVGYKEHQHAWQQAGYQLHFYQQRLPEVLAPNSVVVVINPNNPLTDQFTVAQLQALAERCQTQQALLVIDEAFADIFDADFSYVPHLSEAQQNVIVLRSFGKFFGLAGLRIGFVCSSQYWCEVIQENIGPWSVNGPALYIAEQALSDTAWQVKQQQRLQVQRHKMQQLLSEIWPMYRIESNALFMTLFTEYAPLIYQQLCQHAVYVRLTDEKNALRFGIADEKQLQKLQEVFMLSRKALSK